MINIKNQYDTSFRNVIAILINFEPKLNSFSGVICGTLEGLNDGID